MAEDQPKEPKLTAEQKENRDNNSKLFSKTGVKNGTYSYNSIIHASYELNGSSHDTNFSNTNGKFSKNGDVVDIIGGYPWTIDTVQQKKDNSVINVPHCYAVEYQQRYSSTITNLINTLVGGIQGAKKVGGEIDDVLNGFGIMSKVSGLLQNLQDVGGNSSDKNFKLSSFVNNAVKKAQTFLNNKLSTIHNPIADAGGDNNFMQPYSLLYDLLPTGHRYSFPMLSEPPRLNVKNSFTDNESDSSNLSANSLFTYINTMSNALVNISRDLDQFSTFLGGGDVTSGSLFERTHIEKAKFFQFPQETESYTVSFPLLNTVSKSTAGVPAWKKNYKFIMLFTMRNMIFRKDNTSFYPPLFYDLIIPGTIRQPFTYVESVNVQPMGIVRMLKLDQGDKFLDIFASKSYAIPVPEAWLITIKFKSLIATSANLVLSGLHDVPVTTNG